MSSRGNGGAAGTTRRSFLTALTAAPLAVRGATLSTVGNQPAAYPGWPTLTRLRSGELMAAYSGGREAHVCPFGRVELIRSTDEGRTWNWPQVILDTPLDDRDAGILETPRGALLVTTFTSRVYESVMDKATGWDPAKLARWKAAREAISPERREALLGSWMLRSTDAGMTWSAPYRIPLTNVHGPVALRDGRLLMAGKEYPGSGARIGVCESGDDGLTWRWFGSIPARPGDDPVQYHELHCIEAADGRVIAHIRNHNKANERETLQSESTDGGKTWSVPRAIGVWGLPSHLLRLRDNRLLMTYGYRRAPRGNQARVSADGGRTWGDPIIISDDGDGDLGYPSTVELPSGELVTLWYEARAGVGSLRVGRWRL